MKGFLRRCACNGHRPQALGLESRCSRGRLAKKMLQERGVPRILVAPTGFGKTSLVAEYAQDIFEFRNTFWIDCTDPCFLRELDAKRLGLQLVEAGGEGFLAVFDDVPYLDDARAEEFSETIDSLVDSGWEVVVSTTPAFSSILDHQTVCVRVTAEDLLVDDMEYEGSKDLSFMDKRVPMKDVRRQSRVPALVWGMRPDVDRFALHLVDDLPIELRLSLFIMLVLQHGVMEDVTIFGRGVKKDTRRFFMESYPFLGVNTVSESFDACIMDIGHVRMAFGGCLDEMVAHSSNMNVDSLIQKMADYLVSKRRYLRACEVMSTFCSRSKRASWLTQKQGMLLRVGQPLLVLDLYESLGEGKGACSAELTLAASYAAALLDDDGRCVRYALSVGSDPQALPWQRVLGCCLCVARGKAETKQGAIDGLEKMISESPFDGYKGKDAPLVSAQAMQTMLRAMWDVGMDDMHYESELEECADDLPKSRVGVLILIQALQASERRGAQQVPLADGDLMSNAMHLSDIARGCLSTRRRKLMIPDMLEALLCEAICNHADTYRVPRPETSPERQHYIRLLVNSLEGQKKTVRARMEDVGAPAQIVASQVTPVQVIDQVPPMYLRLFGGLQIRIGDTDLGPDDLRKAKTKTLLAVLALAHCREVPRMRILEVMWPGSPKKKALNNFYSLWSSLRHSLELESGECPYLVRHQLSCMLDGRYVTSDVDELERLCGRLMFDDPDPDAWMPIYKVIQNQFSNDLMPAEENNAYIISMREFYRSRIIDSLVHGANRLYDIQEYQAALWFARAGFERDSRREDTCCALMKAQIANGQSDAAVSVYMHLCSYLNEELGIDPSAQARRLYERAILCSDDGSFLG
ncbi:DNA-binding transcriptional activator of the SARP family [Slackia heliotrinireducens]|nr:BTAD domain-containing putative transcriptional regulator [Slackia heliotrinireducens]VEG99786.1 DNA-binding transcriptional activator of the SARP family [Slackia heliotrinireducens]